MIRVRFMADLSAGRRKLYSRQSYGQPVHAATFIRKRVIVLDGDLEHKRGELARILTHELFHFAWVRLGNHKRRSYQHLLCGELKRHARGELGWSADLRKARLSRNPQPTSHNPLFLDYACESFCDSAAWLYSGVRKHHEFTLAERHRKSRAEWFRASFGNCALPI